MFVTEHNHAVVIEGLQTFVGRVVLAASTTKVPPIASTVRMTIAKQNVCLHLVLVRALGVW